MSKLIFAFAAANGLAALVLAAARQSLPHSTFWAERPNWILAALAITFAVPLTQVVIVERGERKRRKAVELENTIQTFLVTSLVYVAKHAGADWENTGIQAFAVRGWWLWERQDRLARIRLGAIPSSGVKWSKGKGVIGRCWSTRQDQYVDLEKYFAQYAGHSRELWENMPSDLRYGLSFDDFQELKGKYGIVAAVPMVDTQGKYLGCITADMPPGVPAPEQNVVLGSLATTAQLVAQVLRR